MHGNLNVKKNYIFNNIMLKNAKYFGPKVQSTELINKCKSRDRLMSVYWFSINTTQ